MAQPKYRVFISYSHQDRELVEQVAEILKPDLTPMWDRDFRYGQGFHEQIKKFIAHAHVFLPVITKTSDKRKWVHQEIGYAMALNIPVLPLTQGKVPGEMIQQIKSIHVGNDVQALKSELSWSVIDNLVRSSAKSSLASYQCAEYDTQRATMMASYARDVIDLGHHAMLRQKGALSSLHIPNKGITHSVWKERFGGRERSPERCRLQRDERITLEEHCRAEGCKLMINPYLAYETWGKPARIVRLQCLLEFLESISNDYCQVAMNDDMHHSESLTIVGDWFAAESVSATMGQGYRQTIFTRHAPSMMRRIEAFDQEFNERLESLGWDAQTSRHSAVELIKKIISE
jgi:hypothetical protein